MVCCSIRARLAQKPTVRTASSVAIRKRRRTVTIPKPGIYQVDIYAAREASAGRADSRGSAKDLAGSWPLDRAGAAGGLEGDAKFVDSPFGKAVSLDGDGDSVVIPRRRCDERRRGRLHRGGVDSSAASSAERASSAWAASWTHGWYLDMADNRGILRIETAGPDNQSNGTVSSPPGVIRANTWQHVAAVVAAREERQNESLYVNGYRWRKGEIGPANLDNPKMNLRLGAHPGRAAISG